MQLVFFLFDKKNMSLRYKWIEGECCYSIFILVCHRYSNIDRLKIRVHPTEILSCHCSREDTLYQ